MYIEEGDPSACDSGQRFGSLTVHSHVGRRVVHGDHSYILSSHSEFYPVSYSSHYIVTLYFIAVIYEYLGEITKRNHHRRVFLHCGSRYPRI